MATAATAAAAMAAMIIEAVRRSRMTISFLCVRACPLRKTGIHFSGTCACRVGACPYRKTGIHFSGTCACRVGACPYRKTGIHFSGTCALLKRVLLDADEIRGVVLGGG